MTLKNKVVIIASILLTCLLCYAFLKSYKQDHFFYTNLTQFITSSVMVGFTVLYNITESNRNKNAIKIERLIIQMQDILSEKRLYVITNEDEKKENMICRRSFENKFSILKGNTQKVFENEMDYIETQFHQYEEMIDEHSSDFNYLVESGVEFKKFLLNIESKLDRVLFML